MRTNKTILIVFSLLSLNACSSVSDMFVSADDTPPLEGERISILELQKTLTPDATSKENENIFLPQLWVNESWPQAGGLPDHVMQNLSFSREAPQKIWSTNIGKGSRDDLPLNAAPIIADNRVVTLDAKATLRGFNAETGKGLWKKDVGSKQEREEVITGGVAYGNAMLFVTNGHDEILAISPEDGTILWRKVLPAPSRAAPTILLGRVYVSTIDSRLIALNASDGASLWEYRGVGETAGLFGAASPTVDQNIVIVGFSSGELTALRVENGSVAWSDNLSDVNTLGGGLESLSDITAMPLMAQGLVIAMSYNGKMVAIDKRTGSRVWQREIGGTQTPWVAGNMLFALSSENQLIGISLLDGAVFWITELARYKDEKHKKDLIRWSAPLMAGDRLILSGSHGKMIEIDPRNGDVLRETKTKENVQLPMAVSNDTLYVLSEKGKLIAYK